MTTVAPSDEVLFCVASRAAPELLVVNVQMRPCAANLASPAVTLQDSPMQFCVLHAIQPDWSGLRETGHDGLVSSVINLSCCSRPRNLKNRRCVCRSSSGCCQIDGSATFGRRGPPPRSRPKVSAWSQAAQPVLLPRISGDTTTPALHLSSQSSCLLRKCVPNS